MAALTSPHLELPPPAGVYVERVRAARRDEAISMLLTGKPAGEPAAVENFLRFAADQSMSFDHFFAAYRRSNAQGTPGPVLASMLVVPCAGRTAMTFISPLTDPSLANELSPLPQFAMASLDPTRIRLAQALLEPHQRIEAAVLAAGGSQAGRIAGASASTSGAGVFRKLAHLLYLQHPGLPRVVDLALPPGVKAIPYDSGKRRLFADAVSASYEDTADCPALLGIRPIDDVLSGHMATGEFDPRLWQALYHGDEPVGVLLINIVLRGSALELVYVGLSKRWRGRGLGRNLIEHALSLVSPWRAQHLILAVDELNAGALKLYRALDFKRTSRKLAMIHVVGGA